MKNDQAYFFLKPEQHAKYNMVLLPDADVSALTGIDNAKKVYPTEADVVLGYEDVILVCAIISPELQADLESISETASWETLEAVVNLDIITSYAGRDLSYIQRWGVFENHPVLDGQVQTGFDEETGLPVMTDIVSRIVWP